MEKLVSNEEIKNKAQKLVDAIKEDKNYKEYMYLRKELKDDEDIMIKIEQIKKLQKEYVKKAYIDKDIELKLEKLNKELEQEKLYKDYLDKEKEINNILININEGLNVMFNNILNRNNN